MAGARAQTPRCAARQRGRQGSDVPFVEIEDAVEACSVAAYHVTAKAL